MKDTADAVITLNEHARLERTVIDAARDLCSFQATSSTPVHIEKERCLRDAVRALNKFEIEHVPEKKDEREHIVGDDGGSHISWGDYPSTVV